MGRHLWKDCEYCYTPSRGHSGWITTNNPDNPDEVEQCPVCYGRGGFWEDEDTGFHMYHYTDERNELDPKSEYNNRKNEDE